MNKEFSLFAFAFGLLILVPIIGFTQVPLEVDHTVNEVNRALTEKDWCAVDIRKDTMIFKAGEGGRRVTFNTDGTYWFQQRCGVGAAPPKRYWSVLNKETICIGDKAFRILELTEYYITLEKIDE